MSGPISGTIVRLGVRSVFGRRRVVLLFLLPLVLVGLAVLVRVLVGRGQALRHGNIVDVDHDATHQGLRRRGIMRSPER